MLTVIDERTAGQAPPAYSVVAQAPCPTCHVACCREYIVTVTGYDAWLLARNLRLAMEQFLVCCPSESDGDGEYFRLDHSTTRFGIALAKKPEGPEAGWCSFWLSFDGGHGRCGIYRSRPLVCRTYPFTLEDRAVRVRSNAMCPQGSWKLDQIDLAPHRSALLQFEMERAIYCRCVGAWNRYVESCSPNVAFPASVYYGYLTETYDRLEQVRAQITPDDDVALIEHWKQCAGMGVDPLDCRDDGSHLTQLILRLRAAIDGFGFRGKRREVIETAQ